MNETAHIAAHYEHGGLLDAIRAGVQALGKSVAAVTIDDLGPVDEFHIGGRAASERFLAQLALSASDHVLDAGCGLGGASRFVAHRFRSRVTGIDLTPEYVETGRELCRWVGLDNRVSLEVGSATALPYPDHTFDKAYLMHVGMNIADKERLAAELARVLRPGGVLGIYDVMQVGAGALTFPVPWAGDARTSFVATPDAYKQALAQTGFRLSAEHDRRDFALEFFAQLQASAAAAKGPPPLGLHVLMGETRAAKIKNMVENVSAGRIAPVELIAVRAAESG